MHSERIRNSLDILVCFLFSIFVFWEVHYIYLMDDRAKVMVVICLPTTSAPTTSLCLQYEGTWCRWLRNEQASSFKQCLTPISLTPIATTPAHLCHCEHKWLRLPIVKSRLKCRLPSRSLRGLSGSLPLEQWQLFAPWFLSAVHNLAVVLPWYLDRGGACSLARLSHISKAPPWQKGRLGVSLALPKAHWSLPGGHESLAWLQE